MTIVELLLIAFALSMDAFAVSICKGLSTSKLKKQHYLITGLYFGTFQALMPFLGFLAGYKFQDVISRFDYIIACVLLSIIGINMIKEAFEDDECECCQSEFSFKSMFPLAIATSIDALAVGVTFAAKKCSFTALLANNIIFDIIVIGITTFLISVFGVKIGNVFGSRYKKSAEICGGVILILIGLKSLIEHFI